MDKSDAPQILSGSVAKVTEQLASLDRGSLVELQAQEAAGKNRATLIEAIEARLKALDEAAEGGGDTNLPGAVDGRADPAAEAAGDASPKPAKRPAWQEPDYHGPLTGDQAAWRVANVKPAAGVRRK